MAAGFVPGLEGNLVRRIKPIDILQLSMPIATMEEEIVGVTVRLNQPMRQQSCFKTLSFIALNYQRPIAT